MIQNPRKLMRRKWWEANTYITARIKSSNTPVMPVRKRGEGHWNSLCQAEIHSLLGTTSVGGRWELGRHGPHRTWRARMATITWDSLEEPPVVLLGYL